MALVVCPECGRKNVSDSAETCPECGFPVKSYYDNLKLEKEKQEILEKQMQQKEQESERQNKMIEEMKAKKQARRNKLFGSPLKKVLWFFSGCLLLFLIIILCVFLSNEIAFSKLQNHTKMYCNRAIYEVEQIQDKIEKIDVVYGTTESDDEVENIRIQLNVLTNYCNWVDGDIKTNDKMSEIADLTIKQNTTYQSWDDYKKFIQETYLICDTNEESAETLVKDNAYKSAEERQQDVRSHSLIVSSISHSSSTNYYNVYGTVTNNTESTVRFVKVKICLLDAGDNVIDTDTTYACGSEGLKPGESSKFECYIKKDSRTDSFQASIYDYD